jgi:hypothetical protein
MCPDLLFLMTTSKIALYSRLPQEMIQAIIDHLPDDKPSLKACSLVCKAWTHLARLHLFATLPLKWPLQPATFPFVRHLDIPMTVRLSFAAPTWEEVAPLLVGFHRIISLKLVLMERSLNAISAQTWLALGENLPGVVSLSLTHFKRSDASSVAQAICAFPHLRQLSIQGSITRLPELASAMAFRLSPDLDTLGLDVVGAAAVLEWLLSLPVRPALCTVRLYNLQDRDLAIFNKFIQAFGDALQSLTLSPVINHCMLPHVT